MTQNEWSGSQSRAGASSSQDAVRQEKQATEGLVADARNAASEAGSEAKKMASGKADELQGAAASHLRTFADAVRSAGDELADKEPGPVSDLVRQAAEGLERFSGALENKSSSDMIGGVREFGRQNPVGFLAGSMLAGFALARFASSSTSHSHGSSSEYRRTGGSSDHYRTGGASGGTAQGMSGQAEHALPASSFSAGGTSSEPRPSSTPGASAGTSSATGPSLGTSPAAGAGGGTTGASAGVRPSPVGGTSGPANPPKTTDTRPGEKS